MEEEWRTDMDLEDEVESRKKLDEQKRKLQKELREIEQFSCVPTAATARGGAKEARPHARAPEGAEEVTEDTRYPG